MTSRQEARQRLDATTAQISTLVRTLSLGVLAITWLFLSGDKDAPPIMSALPVALLLCIASLSILAIAGDLAQYMVAYRQELKAYRDADPAIDSIKYDEASWEYRWRALFFRAKQYLAFAATGLLVSAIGFVVISDFFCR